MTTIRPERLAEMPPHHWERAKARMEIVDRFLAQDDRSTRAKRRHAEELGVSLPMFYRLLSLRDELTARGDVRPPGPRRPRDADRAATIEEAIALCGPAATQERVYEVACGISRHRGLPAPHRSQVRRAHGRRGAGAAFGARLGTGASAVLDAAGLGVRVADARRGAVLAVLTAVIDPRGGIADWLVTAGFAPNVDLAPIVIRARRRFGSDGLLISNAFAGHGSIDAERTSAAAASATVMKGSAISGALGVKVGRIAVLPWTPHDVGNEDRPIVSIDDLREVLRVLLEPSRR
jgi:hypothetical protein